MRPIHVFEPTANHAQGRVDADADLLARTQVVTDVPIVLAAEPAILRAKFPRVPGYEIVAELGRGGMGIVYLARQAYPRRLVALKMELARWCADARARFIVEAEAVNRLRHPNVVQIYEVGECDGRPFLALEFAARGT